jgi:hypothetical protein
MEHVMCYYYYYYYYYYTFRVVLCCLCNWTCGCCASTLIIKNWIELFLYLHINLHINYIFRLNVSHPQVSNISLKTKEDNVLKSEFCVLVSSCSVHLKLWFFS